MAKKGATETVIQELGFLLEGFPDLSVEELGAALREFGNSGPSTARSEESSQNGVILACAKAFGNHRQFGSKSEALGILREELGLRLNQNTAWKHITGAVAVKLLEIDDGAGKAEGLIRKFRLKAPKSGRNSSSNNDGTLEMVQGIINANNT